MLERSFGPRHPYVARGRTVLAAAYVAAGSVRQGITLLEDAIVVLERLPPPASAEAAMARVNLAGYLQSHGAYEEALAHCERGVAGLAATYGEDELVLSEALHHLGILRAAMGASGDAREILERTLARLHARDPDDPRIRDLLTSLGTVNARLGRYDEARRQIEESIAMAESALGANHPSLGTQWRTLAQVELLRGDAGEAQRVGQIAAQFVGLRDDERAAVLTVLGRAASALGDRVAADARFEDALALVEPSTQERPTATADVLVAIAEHAEAAGDPRRACELYERAQALRVSVLPLHHLDVAQVHDALARLGGACSVPDASPPVDGDDD